MKVISKSVNCFELSSRYLGHLGVRNNRKTPFGHLAPMSAVRSQAAVQGNGFGLCAYRWITADRGLGPRGRGLFAHYHLHTIVRRFVFLIFSSTQVPETMQGVPDIPTSLDSEIFWCKQIYVGSYVTRSLYFRLYPIKSICLC